METGISYAIIAGLFWGISPVLVKRGLVHADVGAATLYPQTTILVALIVAALVEGELFAGSISPMTMAVLRHRFDHDAQSFDLRAGVGGGTGVERAAARQFHLGEDDAQRH